MRPLPETQAFFLMARRTTRTRGFTLIELMITVAIVGILAAVAYPSYRNSVLKGKRAEGRAALLDLAQQQEKYLTQNGAYLAFTTGAANVPFKMYSGDNQSKAFYNMSASTCNGSTDLRACVLLTATPIVTNSDPAVGALTMTSTGIKSCAVNPTTNTLCW